MFFIIFNRECPKSEPYGKYKYLQFKSFEIQVLTIENRCQIYYFVIVSYLILQQKFHSNYYINLHLPGIATVFNQNSSIQDTIC